jgi:hypothetical protein
MRAAVPVLALAPLLYHLASMAILFGHGVAFLLYIILMSVTVVLASLETGRPWLRFAGWLLAVVPLAFWIDDHQTRSWMLASVVVSVGLWVIVLAPAVRSASHREAVAAWDLRLNHSAGLAAFGGVYLALNPFFTTRALASVGMVAAALNGAVWLLFRERSRDAVHWLGVASALAAVAVAIGFEGEWTVVMWSAEAAALIAVGTQTARFGFRLGGVALFVIAIASWLRLEPAGIDDTFRVLLNARALAGGFVVAALYVAAAVEKRALASAGPLRRERAILLVLAHALTVTVVSFEIASYWRTHTSAMIDADLAGELMLSSWWAIYAGTIIAIGMRRHTAAIRYFAIVLFALTVLKVLAIDTQALEGIYRVLAFLVVGAVMLAASFLYQRGRSTAAVELV